MLALAKRIIYNKIQEKIPQNGEEKGGRLLSVLTLRNVVDVEILQEIQERFSEATGFAVIIADDDGVPVTEPTNFTSFCTQIRSSAEGSHRCILSDKKVGLMAAEQGKAVRHYCHSGLVDMAAPIVLNGKYLGSVLCGQVLIEGQDENVITDIREKMKSLPIDQNLLKLFLEKIEFTSEQRIQSATGMLQLVANYIIKFGADQIAQEEVNRKNQMLMKEMKLRSKLENLLQEAQLKILQSQINPHFLFNTLNTLSRLAYLENAEQTQHLTYSLAKIMRYSLRNIDQLVTLKEELEYTGNYLNIQQYRFQNRIQFEQTIAIDTETIKLPILTIQPIIENAIIHGFEPQDGSVVIKIHGYLDNNHFILEIADTGAGMTEEKLSTIFSETNSSKKSHTTGIGLNNVHKRIQYYFGEDHGITAINSRLGDGTTVRIVIPV
ncbi:PocR ligand-binding domain-containing protein [Thalassobacillus devorans]|uniref:sensor histidine kinase n=1 Tax=Thalassobacillus devorans TaxID=279813 RepID=UPI0004AF3979|nr:PocR ligand-binding domain-containing protein [Thalassobacillus devorans]